MGATGVKTPYHRRRAGSNEDRKGPRAARKETVNDGCMPTARV
jgi:hypothetical protein